MTSEAKPYKPMTHGTENGATNGETNGQFTEYLEKRTDLHDRMARDPSGVSVIEWYNGEASLYDNQFDHANFIYHKDVAACVARVVSDKDSSILDVGAGSGKVGTEVKPAIDVKQLMWTAIKLLSRFLTANEGQLRKHGFKNIDALDGAKNMLKLAEEKGIYNKYIHCMVGPEKIKNVDDASYDVVSCGGSIAKGHLRYNTIQTMLRAVKPGGHLVFSCAAWNFQFPDFSRENLEKCFEDLKRRGLCSGVHELRSFHIGEEVGFVFTLCRGDSVVNGT